LIQTTGILRYDPRISTAEGEIFDPWWLVLEYDSALLDHWRERAESKFGIRLSYPRWGAHISIVSGEAPRRRSQWGEQDGERIAFEYAARIETDSVFYWLAVRSADALAIRAALGLRRNPRRALHMTLGRVKR
jgi:hypothetical protein